MWRMFGKPMGLQPEKVEIIPTTCCVLHNVILQQDRLNAMLEADGSKLQSNEGIQPVPPRRHGNNGQTRAANPTAMV